LEKESEIKKRNDDIQKKMLKLENLEKSSRKELIAKSIQMS
jgi:hypothetical protein